jgi:homoserine kinase
MLLPFWWIYFGEATAVRYYKIESPSELYATVVHPQIELKHQMRVHIKANGFSQSAIMQWGNVGGIAGLYTRLRLNRAFLHDEIVEPAL